MRVTPYDEALPGQLRSRGRARDAETARAVAAILGRVRADGDTALRALTAEHDGATLEDLRVPMEDLEAAAVAPEAAAAIERARVQIATFHSAQARAPLDLEVSPGVRCERRIVPLERIGIYVPGGSAPLVSTLLMVAVPAGIAGCGRRVVCTPPGPDGTVDRHILFAARAVGIDEVYRVGGAQAVGALAYGTATVPRVDKIFGPGNPWVTQAKAQVAGEPDGAAIDMPAGPSEVLVVADAAADPVFVAADLLSQAEHGVDSQVLCVSDSAQMLERVASEVERQLASLPRRAIAAQALELSAYVLTRDLDQALEFSNAYAPEHLILQVAAPRALAEGVRHAGSVFLGPWTPEAVGDYASGTNHVLPTAGFARAWSGLGLEAFQKTITVQELSAAGLRDLGPTVRTLADLEGLDAHGRAVDVRLDRLAAGERSDHPGPPEGERE